MQKMIVTLAIFATIVGCGERRGQLKILVNSKIQHAELTATESKRSVTTSAPDEVVDTLRTLIPYEFVGPGRIKDPQFVVRLFVAGNWAEIRVNTTDSPDQFSLDGFVYECQSDSDFPIKADNVLAGRRANENVPKEPSE